MKEILIFLLNHCLFLFEQYEFRFSDSFYSKSFGGDAYVIIESPSLRMRFTFDRGQLLLELASNTRHKSSWYSIDLLSQLVIGLVENSALLDEHYVCFLVEHMKTIEEAFSGKNIDNTLQILKKLANARAKRLFG